MNTWAYVLILAGIAAVICLLYSQGFAVTKSIAAVTFMSWPGSAADTVALNTCTGWVRRRVRIRESRMYEFALDSRLSKGDAEVSLLDEKKRPLCKLNRQAPNARMELEEKQRYYLCWKFNGATGKCALRWQEPV